MYASNTDGYTSEDCEYSGWGREACINGYKCTALGDAGGSIEAEFLDEATGEYIDEFAYF